MTAAANDQAPATRTQVLAAFAAIYLVWGSTYLAIRVAVETLPPFLMAGARFLVSGLLLYGFLWFTRRIRPTARQWRDNAIVGGFLMLGGNGVVCWAEQKVPSGVATLLISVGPIAVVLLDWAVLVIGRDPKRGARPNLPTVIGLTLGCGGLALLAGPSVFNSQGGFDRVSVGALMLASTLWSAGSLYGKYSREPAEPFTASAIQMLTGSAWLFAASFIAGEPQRFSTAMITPSALGAWAYLTIVGSLVGFTAFVWLMKHCSPARVYTYTYVNPIVAVFLGWLILHEEVTPRTFAAAAIIIAGVAIITTAKTRKPAPKPVPASAPEPEKVGT
ncbi:MAG TPA: EamA family transporter [Candidatus Didemnitutus sp.]|nr:EamA family transporter [Candidatus Didemnitutus sp.]